MGSSEFRGANDVIARAAEQLGAFETPIPFVCECADPGCFQRVGLLLEEYEARRATDGAVVAHAGARLNSR